jgi:hypothetical protein
LTRFFSEPRKPKKESDEWRSIEKTPAADGGRYKTQDGN